MKRALLLFACSIPTFVQPNTCGGLTAVTDSAAPAYPPIARAAHVEGNVIFMLAFTPSGEVEHINLLSGPKLLVVPAKTYVQSWHANPYAGPRTCAIIIRFVLQTHGPQTPPFARTDPQHVTIYSGTPFIQPEASQS